MQADPFHSLVFAEIKNITAIKIYPCLLLFPINKDQSFICKGHVLWTRFRVTCVCVYREVEEEVVFSLTMP